MVEVAAVLGNSQKFKKWAELAQYTQNAPNVQSQQAAPRTRQRQRRLSDAEVERLVNMFVEGTPRAELASHFGIHARTVSTVLTRRGVLRVLGMSAAQIDEASQLYVDRGWSLKRVGDHLGFSAGTIRKALLDAGVRTRPRNW